MAMIRSVSLKLPFDVKALRPGQDRVRRGLFERAVRSSNGRVLGIIHPLYFEDKINAPGKVSDNLFLQEWVSAENYGAYLSHLNAYLRVESAAMFVFTEEGLREKVESWLKGLQLTAPAAMIDTLPGNPTPKDENIIAIAKELGVRKISLTGEVFYQEGDMAIGCVEAARLLLAPLNPDLILELTYPNLKVPCHSRK